MKYLALGDRIQKFRERQGISREELASTAGIPLEKLVQIEADEDQPIIAQLIALAKALKINVADIFRERPVEKSFETVPRDDRSRVHRHQKAQKPFDYSYELLIPPSDDKHINAYLIELPPFQKQSPTGDLRHPGEE